MTESIQKLTHVEHILKRPDSYVGPVSRVYEPYWVRSEEGFEKKMLAYSPALLKIFDEILVNAIDRNSLYPKNTTAISVTIDRETGVISVENNGPLGGIAVKMHEKEGIWNPELTFGHLLTSTNYDDNQKRVVGGRNGYGAKLANVYSTKFTVTIKDGENKKKYVQTWTKNMRVCDPPKITSHSASTSSVCISFTPEWYLFGMSGLDDDIYRIFEKRVYDANVCTSPNCKVKFQGEVLPKCPLSTYAKMYTRSEEIVTATSDNWTVCVAPSDDGFEQVSFVNGICTTKGGTHVDHVTNIISAGVIEEMKKKIQLRPHQVKNAFTVFVKATLVNPSFGSQVKSDCTLKPQEFGSKFEPPKTFVKNILKTSIQSELMALSKFKELKELKKSDGNRKSKITGIPKLDDANKAGTADSGKCTLIITEGDSAKTLAVAGLSIVGRDHYGVFPLRGKCKNVRDASVKQLMDNKEFNDLKKILGLQQDKVYTSLSELRYGRLMIMTDADADGSHIKGLILNMIHFFWPSLLDLGFVVSMVTPIIKATKGGTVKSFYTDSSFRDWYGDGKPGWKIKYYKGLGTSTSAEAREYFKMIGDLTVRFDPDQTTTESVVLAFDKTKADDRKKWLLTSTEKKPSELEVAYGSVDKLGITDFIHKDLVNFSLADLRRSIAHMSDGLKPSQRKVLYACFARNLTSEMKVAQLAAYVSEKTSYHHGEVSLADTIVKLAHSFVGSNNIHLLEPCGQFGCVDPSTDILTWDMTIKKAQDVKVGDILVGDDGLPRIVSKTITGDDDMYKINNGHMDAYTVNSNHILTCYLSGHKSIFWKESTKSWKMMYHRDNTFFEKTISTCYFSKEEAYNKMIELAKTVPDSPIFDINLQVYLKLPDHIKHHIKGVLNERVINWEPQELDIDPYILGSWLGDGSSDCHAISTIDGEIVIEWANWLDKIGCELIHCKNANNHESACYYIRRRGSSSSPAIGDPRHSSENCLGCQTSQHDTGACDYVMDHKKNEPFECTGINVRGQNVTNLNPFKELMKRNGLFKNKTHIPKKYILNSEENRLKLLAGMIDTDGSVKRNVSGYAYGYRIHQNQDRENILESLRLVAGSLGFRAKILRHGSSMLELTITGNNLYKIPVKLERKRIQIDTKKNPMIHNFKVELVGKGHFCGWHIDSNERFLLGDFTVTHNTRLMGGKDASQPRYIFTKLTKQARQLYDQRDDAILDYLDDDGKSIEPDHFVPIIPTVLVNGTEGIGTGFSCYVPPYDPKDISANIDRVLAGKDLVPMKPWFRGFKGTVSADGEGSWVAQGAWATKGKVLKITELPPGRWTQDFKEYLDTLLEKKVITNYTNNSTTEQVDFDITGYEGSDVVKDFKLQKTFHTSNMHLFHPIKGIHKYESPEAILMDFVDIRMEAYKKRKAHMIEMLEQKMKKNTNMAKFVDMVINEKLVVFKRKKQELEAELETLFDKLNDSFDYLLHIKTYQYTHEAVLALNEETTQLATELETLRGTTLSNMWKTDLKICEY
jgi:DNA gyrase/topoisomerase IV subunit B